MISRKSLRNFVALIPILNRRSRARSSENAERSRKRRSDDSVRSAMTFKLSGVPASAELDRSRSRPGTSWTFVLTEQRARSSYTCIWTWVSRFWKETFFCKLKSCCKGGGGARRGGGGMPFRLIEVGKKRETLFQRAGNYRLTRETRGKLSATLFSTGGKLYDCLFRDAGKIVTH
jgi:hypothetical protein